MEEKMRKLSLKPGATPILNTFGAIPDLPLNFSTCKRLDGSELDGSEIFF